MKDRIITQSRLKEILDYNELTGDFTRLKRAGRHCKGSIAGGLDSHGYLIIKINSKPYKAHRLAWLYAYGEFPELGIDHINGVKSDNKLSNIRVVTHSDNMMNKATPKNNTSGFSGVIKSNSGIGWVAYIKAEGKRKHLGVFDEIEDAVIARKNALEKYGYHFNHGRKSRRLDTRT